MKRNLSKLLSLFIAFLLLTGIAPCGVLAGESSPAADALYDVIGYFECEKDGVLSDWWELAAVYGSGADLTGFTLPAVSSATSQPSDYAGRIISGLIRGLSVSDDTAALAALQDPATGSFSAYANQQAYSMIALDAAGRDGSGPYYDSSKALESLLGRALPDGGFNYGFGSEGDPDVSGMVALSLGPYNSASFPAAQTAASNLVSFFENTQTASGGYESWGTENACSIATVVSGLVALGADPLSFYHSESAKTPVDALLEYQLEGGGFKNSAEDSTPNVFATKQSALALADLAAGASVLATLEKNADIYLSVDVRVDSTEDAPFVSHFTLKNTSLYSASAGEAVGLAGLTLEAPEDYNWFLNGSAGDHEDPVTVSCLVRAVPKSVTRIASFGSESLTLEMNEETVLTLSAVPVSGGDPEPLAGASITLNGDVHSYFDATDVSGNYALSFLAAGTYIASAVPVAEDGVVTALPYCRITVNPAAASSTTVCVQVEGREENLLYNPSVTVHSDGTRLATVMDAVTSALDAASVDYCDDYGYISSVGGEEASGSAGWLFVVNGQSPMAGMDSIPLSEGDDIVLYYGDWMNTVYPTVSYEAQLNGSLEITVRFAAGGAFSPLPDATLYWDGDADNTYTTDSDGKAVIPASKTAPGSHTLQLEKVSDGIPLVIRLAPGYAIVLSGGGDPSDDDPAPPVQTVSIRVLDPMGITYLARSYLSFSDGMTALSLLQSTGLSVTIADGGQYVSSIEGLSEYDEGSESGWMYRVNRVFPGVSCSAYALSPGDYVEFLYTRDFGLDIGGYVEDNGLSPAAPVGAAIPPAATVFSDTSGKWMDEAANYLSSRGIVNGVAPGIFAPERPLTRADFVLMLMRAFSSEAAGGDGESFSDVPGNSYYCEALLWARALGIAAGSGNNRFDPESPLTRQDMFLLSYRALSALGLLENLKESSVAAEFADAGYILDYTAGAINGLSRLGLIQGSGGRLLPRAAATRGEGAQLMYNILVMTA